MSYNFCVKSNIEFGKDAVKKLPDLIEKYNMNKIMVVYDGGVKAAGIAEKIVEQVDKSGAKYIVFDKVIPNPTNEVIEEASKIAKAENINGFIAVGGGSSIDLAKAVNVLMTNPGEISQYGGMDMVKNPTLPLIAIPTTAGTSSEITNVSALIDTKKVIKYVVIDNNIIPTHVIADPEFTKTMPKSVTAATGMDAITHAVESYISNMATPLTKYNSITGLKILYDNLPLVVADGSNTSARENMMLGCIITGFGFSNANLGLVHAIAHTLSAHFGLAHGMANATVLPYVIRFNADACEDEMIEMAKAIDLKTNNDAQDKYLLSNALLDLTKKLGINTLKEQGVEEKDFDMIATDVLLEPVLGFNPRQGVTKEDVIKILEMAY
ncbi:MAG: iron-containing alcohol dehydrogenase [Lachnospiraceae bacterium]|jgi:alcohol dehydrogenase|nr:iron-containing alcohol dehydrogenase [Lachnospiraceae bacterium]